MKRQAIVLIIVWSGILAAGVFANPPSGTPGTTSGVLFSDNAGNIGIKTFIPATALDVNGTVTIRKSLNMANNRIINLIAPATSTDAASKAYTDAQTANMASSTMRLWGEGRPGTNITNAAGECTNTVNGAQIKVSRSSNTATWDGSRAACPANWWVCSATERGTGACASGVTRNAIYCNPAPVDEELTSVTNDWAWISDTATTNDRKGKITRTISGANTLEQYACSILPVWCCSY